MSDQGVPIIVSHIFIDFEHDTPLFPKWIDRIIQVSLTPTCLRRSYRGIGIKLRLSHYRLQTPQSAFNL